MCIVHFPKANYKMSRNKCHAFDRLHRSYYLPRNLLIDLRSAFPFCFYRNHSASQFVSFSWLKVFLIILPILGCVRNDTFEFYRFYYELILYHCQGRKLSPNGYSFMYNTNITTSNCTMQSTISIVFILHLQILVLV